jgi:nucleotide-binding universal stress UspA family protein
MTISKILIIANASRQASLLILDAFQIIQKHQPSVRAIFLSCLSELFKKNLGPNTLNYLVKEQEESLERVRNYFTRMEIPYSFKVITASPWETILNEAEKGDQDLIILQGEFLKIWRQDTLDYGLCSHAIYRLSCPILLINQTEEASLSHLFNSEGS